MSLSHGRLLTFLRSSLLLIAAALALIPSASFAQTQSGMNEDACSLYKRPTTP